MSSLTQVSLSERRNLIENPETRSKIIKLSEESLNKKFDDTNDEKIGKLSTEIKNVKKLWKIEKRLYPPFREKRKLELDKNDELQLREKNIIDSPIAAEGKKFRLTVCLRKKQFPLICTNIPFICDEQTLNLQRSTSSYSSFGYNADKLHSASTCGSLGAPCIELICGKDNEPCSVTRGTNPVSDVCEDVGSGGEDNFDDDVSISQSNRYMIVCGESNVDYVICECTKEEKSSTFTDNEFEDDEALREYQQSEEYLDFQDVKYEHSDFTSSEHESELLSKSAVPELKLFQDPLVSHRLKIPYKEIPSSRYRVGEFFNDFSKTILLEKRPQSPVRNIQEGRFDVRAGKAKAMKRSEIQKAKHTLRLSKEFDRTENSDLMLLNPDTSHEPLTAFLRVVLGGFKLSLGDFENDLSMTLTTIWAITEFAITEMGPELTESITITNLGVIPKSKRSLSYNLTFLKATTYQQAFDITYPPKGSDVPSLHRAMPSAYLCAIHAEGHQKYYDNLRTCIDKFSPLDAVKKPRAAYLPDISCSHFKEMPSKKVELAEENLSNCTENF